MARLLRIPRVRASRNGTLDGQRVVSTLCAATAGGRNASKQLEVSR